MRNRRLLICICLCIFAGIGLGAGYARTPQQLDAQRPRTTLPYKDGIVVLTSDTQDYDAGKTSDPQKYDAGKAVYRLSGNVRITFQDVVITCDRAEYNEITREGATYGATRFSQGKQWFTCSRSEFNLATQTARFYDAVGFTDDEFLLEGKLVIKTGSKTYSVDEGLLTACLEDNPKWAFDVGNANIHIDRTARLHRILFKVKGVPVFYLPYLIVPLETKKRSSGFTLPHTGSSSSKGRQINVGYYQTLGNSADLLVFGDYFSLRGFAPGGIFKARPNEQTSLNVQAYGINDRLGFGGARLLLDGSTRFQNGFRAVARVNITTNFRFRQAFSEGLRSATIPEEQALIFATRNDDSFATNFAFERREVFFPGRSLVIRKSPSLEFVSLGKPIGKSPLVFEMRAAAEGLYRLDSSIETPRIVHRLDFHPRLSLRVPSLAGFSLFPSIGIRETYYSAHLSGGEQPVVVPTPFQRRYADLNIDLRTPELEKHYHSETFGDFRHLVQPMITYRRIHGIEDPRGVIRFDDQDAIADTNEVEYGIVNRIMRRQERRAGFVEDYEFLAFSVAQKYYFDPTFGGAFRPGEYNAFFPLGTLSGFAGTGIQRTLSPTNLSLRMTPRPGFSYEMRADYDTRLGRLRDTSLWGTFRHEKLFFAGTYVKTNVLEPTMFLANHVQGQVSYNDPPLHGFSISVTMSYNIQTRALLNSNSRLNYFWDCCGVSMEFQQYDLGVRTESRFTFSFSLKGIGSFGNLKGPDRLF